MRSTKLVKNQQEKSSSPFAGAAAQIIEIVDCPNSLLAFLLNSLDWIREYEFSHERSASTNLAHSYVVEMIEQIYAPWNTKSKDAQERMSVGIFFIWDIDHSEPFAKAVDVLTLAHTNFVKIVSFNSKAVDNQVAGFKVLYALRDGFREYEKEMVA